MYTIKFNDGYVTKRHVDQIVKTQLGSDLRRGENTENSETPAQENIVNSERIENQSGKCDKCYSDNKSNEKVSDSDLVKRHARKTSERTDQNAYRRSARLAKKIATPYQN